MAERSALSYPGPMLSERASLIAAIRAAPDDDALRLACADWFEEQGDAVNVARAEFIRIQVRRASLPPEDISHSELQARELRLLKRHGPAWCGSHFVFRKARFRRGFIEYVHLHLRHFLHHRRQMLELEPVRDVSLTGWHRAPTDLIRRVAGCTEWQDIERLRIHHQGPHKDPGSDVVLLLESPHLTRLRALHCPGMAWDADARRRFERLPILRRIRELRFPTLDTLMQRPGEWFSEGGLAFAEQWGELKSLALPFYATDALLRQLSDLPFRTRLTALEGAPLAILRQRLPDRLKDLRLVSNQPIDDSFCGRLVQSHLRSLHLAAPISPAVLAQLLDGTGQCRLQALSLEDDGITENHARVIAMAPAANNLLSLSIDSFRFDSAAFTALLGSGRPSSLVRLTLSTLPLSPEAAKALADANGWDRLRRLQADIRLDADALRPLLASPNLRRLTWWTLRCDGASNFLTPELATEITRLPNLAFLHLNVGHCDPTSRAVLSTSDALAWSLISCEETPDIQSWRNERSHERLPPLDALWERSSLGNEW